MEENQWRRKQRVCYLFSWVFIALCIACVIGLIVCIVLFGLKKDANNYLLLAITLGASAGTAAFALAGVGLSKLSLIYAARLRDVKERSVSEESFFAGENTLATFQKEGLLLHSTEKEKTKVFVPFNELRVFSVCTRARAREKGEWSIVLEIPMRFLAKDKKAQKELPPALIELEHKPRLLAVLNKFHVSVSGEERREGEKQPFTLVKKFSRPVAKKRKRALILAALGAILFGGGIALSFTLSVPFGAILITFGFFIAARGCASFLFEKTKVAVFREGIYWNKKEGAPARGTFLKWSEVRRIYVREEKEERVLALDCDYGAYDCPLLAGVMECVTQTVPELMEKEK